MTAVPTDRHLDSVCRPGHGGDTCAYLTMRPVAGGSIWQCAKSDPIVTEAIRERLAQGTMKAQGDNCSGPPEWSVP